MGTLAGVFTGLVGLLFMPLLGAMAGELMAQRRLRDARGRAGGSPQSPPPGPPDDRANGRYPATRHAAKVGLATWLGLLVGTAVKLALVFTMIGVFIVALLV